MKGNGTQTGVALKSDRQGVGTGDLGLMNNFSLFSLFPPGHHCQILIGFLLCVYAVVSSVEVRKQQCFHIMSLKVVRKFCNNR